MTEKQEIKIDLTENALAVLEKRYLKKKSDGSTETPLDLFKRVAKSISSIEGEDKGKWNEEFLWLLTNLYFLPSTPVLLNAGTGSNLNACFILDIPDSLPEIMQTLKDAIMIHSTGGGTGFSFSDIRPKNSSVKNIVGAAAGPVSFMKMFNAATEEIKQSGVRRGANMSILRVDHPDIVEFIDCKTKEGNLNNFNISVALTDKFIHAVQKNQEYELVDPQTKKVVSKLKAKDIFNKIVSNAWKNGEPGVVFIDRINKFNPVPHLGEIKSSNPCGEIWGIPYFSCNLGSINLSKLVKDKEIDYELLKRIVKSSVRFLDNVIDVNVYLLPKISEVAKKLRPIGLGIMGFADMLIKMEISYNSRDALDLAEEIMKFISDEAWKTSEELAKEKGEFPEYNKSKLKKRDKAVRNCQVTTIAPTGSLSILAGCSSGIEPYFNFEFYSKQADIEFRWIHPEYAKYLGGTVPDYFITAHQVLVHQHINIQSSFQRYVDNGISKTINFNNSATEEDVAKAYWRAWETNCKGVTIYRDGSRESQVLYTKKGTVRPEERPERTYGFTEQVQTGCGKLYVTLNNNTNDEKGNLIEVFSATGKFGGCASQSEAICRLISLALRSNIAPESISEQLVCIKCASASGQKKQSCPRAIGGLLLIKDNKTQIKLNEIVIDKCPECGQSLERSEGCFSCKHCGYSKCK